MRALEDYLISTGLMTVFSSQASGSGPRGRDLLSLVGGCPNMPRTLHNLHSRYNSQGGEQAAIDGV